MRIVFLAFAAILSGCASDDAARPSVKPTAQGAKQPGVGMSMEAAVVADYAELVHRSYAEAHDAAVKMQKAIDAFLAQPNEKNLAAARAAWLAARDPYSRTEAFRYYEGPIDAEGGPEGQINAWPLNEAYIDSVQGGTADRANLIADTAFELNEKSIIQRNAKDDEADVTTGYHAIEFLLWGQDASPDSPGKRPADDFKKGDPIRERRATYLKLVTDLLVKDLASLVEAWDLKKEKNYRASFTAGEPKVAIEKILTGLATLSGFELAGERLAAGLDSGSQEDEQSCFSDNTVNDLIHNCQGIANVYFGTTGKWSGKGLNVLVDARDPALNQKIEAQLRTTQTLANALDVPYDKTLASPKGSAQRTKAEDLVKSLQIQADLLTDAGKALGVNVVIKGE